MNSQDAKSRQSNLNLALIGSSVEKSLSPKIYHLLAPKYSVKLNYQLVSLELTELNDFINNKLPDYQGINVTTPFKRSALELLKKKKNFVAHFNQLQNCNTVQVGESYHAYNTDLIALEKILPQKHHGPTLIYGSGDVVETIICILKARGTSSIDIMTRKVPKNEFPNCRYLPWKRPQKPYQVIINATPAGTKGDPVPLPNELPSYTVDLNYTKEHRQLENLQRPHSSGLEMLIWQALENFEIWTGLSIEKEKDFREIYHELS